MGPNLIEEWTGDLVFKLYCNVWAFITDDTNCDINVHNGKSLILLLSNSAIPNHIGNIFAIDLNIININDDVRVILTIDSKVN